VKASSRLCAPARPAGLHVAGDARSLTRTQCQTGDALTCERGGDGNGDGYCTAGRAGSAGAVADGAAAKGTIGQRGNAGRGTEGYGTVGECSSAGQQRVRWNGAGVEEDEGKVWSAGLELELEQALACRPIWPSLLAGMRTEGVIIRAAIRTDRYVWSAYHSGCYYLIDRHRESINSLTAYLIACCLLAVRQGLCLYTVTCWTGITHHCILYSGLQLTKQQLLSFLCLAAVKPCPVQPITSSCSIHV
jgi:hypothetical protein